MNKKTVEKIFRDTAYVRTGGSQQEKQAAAYIQSLCPGSYLEDFSVDMAHIREATLTIDGRQIPCKGYLCAGSSVVEGSVYYLKDTSRLSLSGCKGKIVLLDGYLGYWKYQDIFDNGAIGFITYDGNINYADRNIDQRELRSYVSQGKIIPGVNINAKDAVAIIRDGCKNAVISLNQDPYEGTSQNVILDLPGKTKETIVLTAHYDSTSLSQGAYDNMSGCVGLLALAERFRKENHRYSLRFIWCGSEERGLLGSKAYCEAHKEELENIVLNINLDMIGCIMGNFLACCTSEEALVTYLSYLSAEKGMPCKCYQDVYSSDSTPFADNGIPAVSFARIAPNNTATIHNSYDTKAVMSAGQLLEDVSYIGAFLERMSNAILCPVKREMPENMKEKLDEYLLRKRPKNS